MSPTCRTLDARGLPCPQPVILARKALAEGGFDTLEITVDDAASRENLLKFGAYAKCQVEAVDEGSGLTRIRMSPQGFTPAPALTEACPLPEGGLGGGPAEVVFLSADSIGQGDLDLARLLMRGFVYTLTEAERVPRRLLLMNSGVKLAVEGSESLANLQKLEARGVEVLACGTCLEFFGLTSRLGVGGITNMYEIAGHLMEGPTLSVG
ncbi:MAG: sulfurtransferase-like selenium metabolism protein YedF [Holophagaceae bacterium]|nr:sulfurtransferase-like selenium metabolism protein YedF [Holophagaceae bacterium]